MELVDLGRVYNQPLKDSDGNLFFILIKKLKNATSGHNLKLIQISKYLQKSACNDFSSKDYVDVFVKNLKVSCINNNNNDDDYLLSNFSCLFKNIIEYDRFCDKKINKGLYLAYLKIQSSMDLVKVMVLNQRPSILPCHKIRDNSNVSK